MALTNTQAKRLVSTQCGFTAAQQRFLTQIVEDIYLNELVSTQTAQTSSVVGTTLTDSEMTVTLEPSTAYSFEIDLFAAGDATGDLDVFIDVAEDNGESNYWLQEGGTSASLSSEITLNLDGNDQHFRLVGFFYSDSTGGDLTVQFAQNVSNGLGAYLYEGSTLRLRKIS